MNDSQAQQKYSAEQNSNSLNPTQGQSSDTSRQRYKDERMDRADKLGDFLVKLLYPEDEDEEE